MDQEENNLLKKISATLFLYNEAITVSKLKSISGLESLSKEDLEMAFDLLNKKLNEIGLILIRDSSLSFEKQELMIVIKKEMSEIAKSIKKNELENDLTPAALQVITICSYLNGATKHEINLIRGVQSSQSIRSLSSRGLVRLDSGKYFPTVDFLKEMGISKIEELSDFEKIKNDFQEKLKEFREE